MDSVIETLKQLQKNASSKIAVPNSQSRIAFVFPTKDRVEATKKTLASMDTEKGFDLIWIDGSETAEGKALPDNYKFNKIKVVEIYKNVKGKEHAGYFGLNKLFELGYDYIGQIENELIFESGWFQKLLQLFELASKEGLAVGAATVRNYNSRVIEYRNNYTINWNIGAGMALWSRSAYGLIKNVRGSMTARKISRFYAETLGIELGEAIFRDRIDRIMSTDWIYEMILYKNGLTTVGSIPTLAHDLILDIRKDLEDSYVEKEYINKGLVRPRISWLKLQKIKLTEPFFLLVWNIINKSSWLYKFLQKIQQKYAGKIRYKNMENR